MYKMADPNLRYHLLKQKIDSCNNDKKIKEAIDYYFRVHEGKETPDISDYNKKELLIELAGETVNRDYIAYLSTGTWGNTTSEMIKIVS